MDDNENKEVVTQKTPRPRGRPKADPSKLSINNSKSVAKEFYRLCCLGQSLTQIAAALNIPKETMLGWSTNTRQHKDFAKAFKDGQTAWQAYHENLLQKMITGEDGKKYAAAEITAQQFILKTQFKADWTEKKDSKSTIEINHVSRMSDEQLEQQILNLLSKSNIKDYLVSTVVNTQTTSDGDKLKLVVNNDD